MNDQATRNLDYATPRSRGGIGTQTWGLFVDAYRDLHSRKLFWITLGLSLLVALVFLFVGINERGIVIFGKELPGAWNTNFIPRGTFYRFLYTDIAVPIWLGICAAVLALISVGGVFPDMLSGGSIDLYLSKPISRVRLFLSKYLFALLFVAFQVLAFSAASFLVLGIRGNAWEPGVFLAVPLVTLFFSYLYCICVLLGILTRSTLAAILLTILFWGLLFAVNSSDEVLLMLKTAADRRVESQQHLVAGNEDIIARINEGPEDRRGAVKDYEFQRDKQREKLVESEETLRQLRFWHNLVLGIKAPLPKTAETVQLMGRWLVDPDPFFAAEEESEAQRQARRAQRGVPPSTRRSDDLETYMHAPDTARQMERELNERSVAWVIGTSVGFEAVILALAAWIFCRRDF